MAAWCDELSRATRTGSTLPAAIRAAPVPASCGEQIGQLTFALDRGMPLRDAIAGAPRAPHLDLALTVLTACAEHGGHPGQPLDRAAATLRARAADLADRRTQSAQARLSAVVMTILPLLMLAVMLVASAPIRGALASPVGLVVLVIGGALNVLGWRWMQRLIDRPPR
ncbi:type II secretion system F family protein [Ilumatobacter sp.]|uniref:type II secretion system F family protein n=1 Tax=Ilumatobacter sp. TaxID=1967498 RepID=UPI0026201C40|nr:type II secretion system F family protein [Ilumatobacter sp.]